MLKGKSLQSDWVQSHKLSHNIVNFLSNVVIFEHNIYRNVHCLHFPKLEQLNSHAEFLPSQSHPGELPLSFESKSYRLVPMPTAKT